ncbi:MAG: twin transmembrane helix small protein [Rhodocyclaceae bacterium]|nr:MAG: twin transmembrane helix small protein [Rhodocyclaceae bacterium]
MNTMMLLIALGILATVAILFTGLGSMVKGGEFDDRHSHQLMFARVGLQGFTLLLLVVAVLLNLH